MTSEERNQRIVDLVTAEGSVVKPSALNLGMVVVIDGRTGLDACEQTADAAFEVLFREADGEGSPPRLDLVLNNGAPEFRLDDGRSR